MAKKVGRPPRRECIYRGTRDELACTVTWGAQGYPLPLYLRELNRSPDGVQWSYNGAGPTQLAYAVIRHAAGKPPLDPGDFVRFREEVVARIEGDRWAFSASWVRRMLRRQERAETDRSRLFVTVEPTEAVCKWFWSLSDEQYGTLTSLALSDGCGLIMQDWITDNGGEVLIGSHFGVAGPLAPIGEEEIIL